MSVLIHLFRSSWFWLALTVGLLGLDYLLFFLIPRYAKALQEDGDRRKAIRMLEILSHLPALGAGEGVKALVRYQLGVGSSRVDLQACKLEYSIVSPK